MVLGVSFLWVLDKRNTLTSESALSFYLNLFLDSYEHRVDLGTFPIE